MVDERWVEQMSQQMGIIQGELKEGLRRIDERVARIEEVCKCREGRLRSCEDAILKVHTITSTLPYISKLVWCAGGSAAALLLSKFGPLLLSLVQQR